VRVLHLFSNHKWTGPAEPALNLCLALRCQGIAAEFACAPGPPAGQNKIVETARDRGLEPVLRFTLAKHRQPLLNFLDRGRLRRYLRQERFDLIHCHLDNDHQIAAPVAAEADLPLIRSSYRGNGFPDQLRYRRLLRKTAFLIEASGKALQSDAAAFNFEPERMQVVPGAIDTDRFDPAHPVPDGRKWLNIAPDVFAAGIVARLQTHRRYEDLFRAFRRLLDVQPDAQLIVIGRGTKEEQVGLAPVRELGIEDHVHFTGFIDGENYAGMLRALDAGVYLVPGSDGTCRAAREIMAMGRPVIAADRGMLAEIVTHEQDGLIFDGSEEALAQCLIRLASDRRDRARLGKAARLTARTRYALDVQAARVAEIYRRITAK
jgi:glycosyltransferase involved in cell wall biosynthesis